MRKKILLIILLLVFCANTYIASAQTMLPPKYWRYELKPYYSRIVQVNSAYFIIEKQLYAGGKARKIQYVYDQVQNKYTPLNPKYKDLMTLNENGAGFYAQYVKSADKKMYGFLNFDKKIFQPPNYTNFLPFKDGTAVVQLDKTGKYYIINELGEVIRGPFNNYLTSLDEEEFRLKRVNVIDNAYHSHHEYVYTDAYGKEIFGGKKFLSAHPFYDGYAMVATDMGRCGYINTNGQQVVPYKYTNCSNFKNGSALTYNPKTKNTVLIDKKLNGYVIQESYGALSDHFLQTHDPNGLVIYSKYTNNHNGVTLPKYYKTIYARKNNGQVIIPSGLYFEGEHVYKGYYLFKKYELRKDSYGAYLVKSNDSVIIDKMGKVYDTYQEIKALNIPYQYIAELKKEKLMALDKNISGEHRFSWINFKNKKGSREDNSIRVMENGRYGLIKFNAVD